MIDPVTGSKLVTVTLPDGTKRHLRKCSPSDWMRMENVFRQVRKLRVFENLTIKKATPEAIDNKMEEMDKWPVRHSDLVNFLNEHEGQRAAILFSIAKDYSVTTPPSTLEEEFDRLGQEPWQWLRIACDLFNVAVVISDSKKNELTESGGTTTATGSSTPTSSDQSSIAPTTL